MLTNEKKYRVSSPSPCLSPPVVPILLQFNQRLSSAFFRFPLSIYGIINSFLTLQDRAENRIVSRDFRNIMIKCGPISEMIKMLLYSDYKQLEMKNQPTIKRMLISVSYPPPWKWHSCDDNDNKEAIEVDNHEYTQMVINRLKPYEEQFTGISSQGWNKELFDHIISYPKLNELIITQLTEGEGNDIEVDPYELCQRATGLTSLCLQAGTESYSKPNNHKLGPFTSIKKLEIWYFDSLSVIDLLSTMPDIRELILRSRHVADHDIVCEYIGQRLPMLTHLDIHIAAIDVNHALKLAGSLGSKEKLHALEFEFFNPKSESLAISLQLIPSLVNQYHYLRQLNFVEFPGKYQVIFSSDGLKTILPSIEASGISVETCSLTAPNLIQSVFKGLVSILHKGCKISCEITSFDFDPSDGSCDLVHSITGYINDHRLSTISLCKHSMNDHNLSWIPRVRTILKQSHTSYRCTHESKKNLRKCGCGQKHEVHHCILLSLDNNELPQEIIDCLNSPRREEDDFGR